KYFGKSAGDVDVAEAALLAGLPQLPEVYSPLNNPDSARERRDQVLERLVHLGWISEFEFSEAVTEPVEVHQRRSVPTSYSAFADLVRREVASDPKLRPTDLGAEAWIIETTLDRRAQEIATDVLARGLDAEEQVWLAGRPERFLATQRSDAWHAAPAPGQMRMATVVRRFDNSLVVELSGGWRG